MIQFDFKYQTRKVFSAKIMNKINKICIINDYEAIKEFEKPNTSIPNIILLDINMPILNGWDFLAEFIKIAIPHRVAIYLVVPQKLSQQQ